MKRIAVFICILAGLVLAGCSQKEDVMDMKITSFVFKAADNPELSEDVSGSIIGNVITFHLEYLDDASSLVPTFDGVFDKLYWNGHIQHSGESAIDFTGKTVLVLHDGTGNLKDYSVYVYVANKVPKVEIWSDSEIKSKVDYVAGKIRISNCPAAEELEAPLKIRGRGNATWFSYPKKCYKFKLDEAASVLGFPENRDWVLLAEYCDKSLLRTTYMNSMATVAGVEWVPKATHVDFYLNGSYNGTYLLIEQVEKAKHKISINDDGFLIENDNYYSQEPLFFQTSCYGYFYTFKYPDPEASDGKGIAKDDASYSYILNFMNEFESALQSSDYRNPSTGYRKYIDVQSFVKWYLVMELLDCQDPNFYYVLPYRGAKLKMEPLWDAEWTLGLASAGPNGWVIYPDKPYFTYDKEYWRPQRYFGRLFSDPYFVDLVYQEWQSFKANLPLVKQAVADEATLITKSQEKNFKRWDILGKYVSVDLVAFPTWQEEVDYASDWLDKRVGWFDPYITNLHDTVK